MKNHIYTLILLLSFTGYAQQDEFIVDKFEDYSELTREQVHLHLNKTTFIKGEMLGFNAYVFLKDGKDLSNNTVNLYCQITDVKGEVLKEKLLLVTNGISRGEFMIDSTFSSGEYYIKAYTNWMRNFTYEANYFIASLNIIDPEVDDVIGRLAQSDEIEVQLLPESGHLLANTENIVAVIAKDGLGKAVPNLKIKIVDDSNNQIEVIRLDEFGMERFTFIPHESKSYIAEYSYNDKIHRITLQRPNHEGVIINLQNRSNVESVLLNIKTNEKSKQSLVNKIYTLAIHNGLEIITTKVVFTEDLEITQLIPFDALFSGVNVFTLFNEKLKPVAERMFFNYKGLKLYEDQPINFITKNVDSTFIKLKLNNVDSSEFNNFSISILPSTTLSYNPHNSIVSSLYLNPFLSDPAENAGYYFDEPSEKKHYQLDNLLLTKGWSSYDWTMIFNNPPNDYHNFEVGLSYTINRNKFKEQTLIIFPTANSKSELIKFNEGQKTLERQGFFPLEDEDLKIGATNKNGQLLATNLFFQFAPSFIKPFNIGIQPITQNQLIQRSNTNILESSILEGTQLDEVKLFVTREYTRAEKLQNKTLGKITEFNDTMRRNYRTIGQFLSRRGFKVEEGPYLDELSGELTYFRIFNRQKTNVNVNKTESPQIFLDNVPLLDLDLLYNWSMENVDYININRAGIGEGMRGGFGVIRIYTDPEKAYRREDKPTFTSYDIPLKFSTPKRFYVPKYKSSQTDFYKKYAVVDWLPNVQLTNNGTIEFNIENVDQDIILFIEGVVNSNQLVQKRIRID